jgi:hypothetical protein
VNGKSVSRTNELKSRVFKPNRNFIDFFFAPFSPLSALLLADERQNEKATSLCRPGSHGDDNIELLLANEPAHVFLSANKLQQHRVAGEACKVGARNAYATEIVLLDRIHYRIEMKIYYVRLASPRSKMCFVMCLIKAPNKCLILIAYHAE